MEDAYLGKATERLFLPLLRLVQPEIVDMDLPIEGVFHDCAIISIRKSYPGQARKVMSAVWGMGQMMFTKFVVVVDEHVDVHDYSEVTWRVFNNVDPRRDCLIVDGPLDVLDHSSPLARYGAKMGIDATKTWPEEGHGREWPRRARHGPGRRQARHRALGRAGAAVQVDVGLDAAPQRRDGAARPAHVRATAWQSPSGPAGLRSRSAPAWP